MVLVCVYSGICVYEYKNTWSLQNISRSLWEEFSVVKFSAPVETFLLIRPVWEVIQSTYSFNHHTHSMNRYQCLQSTFVGDQVLLLVMFLLTTIFDTGTVTGQSVYALLTIYTFCKNCRKPIHIVKHQYLC